METLFAFYNPFPNQKCSAVSKQGMALAARQFHPRCRHQDMIEAVVSVNP